MENEFDRALESLDFAVARQLVETADEADRAALAERLQAAIADAEERAESLAGRIQSLARADHYEGLLALADDPETPRLLEVLTPEIRRGAQLHLDGARRRQQRFQTAAETHMKQAGEALLLMDTTAARAALDRIDRRWLSVEQATELDELVAQTEAVSEERRDIEARTAEVLREHEPVASAASESRRPRGARGCASSALVALLVITALVAI